MSETQQKSMTMVKENIIDLILTAKKVRILGANPFVETLVNPQFNINLRRRLETLFKEDPAKKGFFKMYMESEQEDFYQQLTDNRGKTNYKMQYTDKKARLFGKEQANYESALLTDVVNRIERHYRDEGEKVPEGLLKFVQENIIVRQLNLRMPYFAIAIDEDVWYCPLSLNVPDLSAMIYLDDQNVPGYKAIKSEIIRYFIFLETSDEDAKTNNFKADMGGKKFTSKPDAELIEAYDEITDKRVAIFDRKAFLTLEYKRASIWGFIFNRKGQLLLQKRGNNSADNRGMWDKSTGGHVDLTDASTVETAKREFIEEVYTKDGEFSKYNTSKTEMIVDFGEWRRALRDDETFIEAFSPFTGKDKHIIMFRAFVEADKRPLTVDRDSMREITTFKKDAKGEDAKDKNGNKIPASAKNKPTRFRSDVFFFITAENEIDTDEQMKKTFMEYESKESVVEGHRLIDIAKLRDEVFEYAENKDKIDANAQNGEEPDRYTDDMVHIIKNYWGYLTEFSSFVKDTFERINLK